ncbi:MAG: carotenoid biosynthesis protein [Chloroflexi bacterium HGW-Chloroflexi-6]|nr:MAG: carotenoid biosynthesis protein [Chloroflexi bacterium HGW-Chloroflexi-6]
MIEAFNAIRYPRSTIVPLVLWVLTMITLPILGWILGEGYLIRGMAFGVIMQAAAVLAILFYAWGWARTLKTFAIVVVLSYLAEFLGSSTGIPFGKYEYTGLLQPQLAGVPLLIPLAWMMMLPPAWAIASIILKKTLPHNRHEETQRKILWGLAPFLVKFVFLSSLAFTAWDLFLDPQMVGWGFWVWENPGAYFGIPLSNYLGWIVVSAIITLAANPKNLPVGPLSLVYVLTWLLQTIGQGIFWSQPGPAAVGFVGSGIFVWLAWKKSIKSEK